MVNAVLKGQVLDAQANTGLSGVSVQIKGVTNGTTTDDHGAFTLYTGQKLPFTLVVSYIGYETQELVVDGSPVTIHLKEAFNQLNDVVVVGYGTQKRSDLTGSVASLPKEALNQQVSSFERLLQGAVPGVQITQTSGQPGSPVSVRIRGGNSITAGNEPLYVVDGFPIYNNNGDASAGVASGPNINALSGLNPSDIESIDVLKDASATAIYGSRGANGVVLITTKKGKAGRNVVTYDGSYGVQRVGNKVDVLTDAKQWALLKNDARVNAGKSPYYSDEELANLSGGTDWQEAAFRTAPAQNHQLTILGGDEKTHYTVSGNYYKQEGVLLNTDFERISGRLNLDRQVSTKFKVSANFTASKTNAQIAEDNIVRSLLLMPPTVPIWDANGAYTYQSAFETPLGNPIATLTQETNQSNTSRILGNAYGEYQIADGLTAKISFGADIINNKENRYIPTTLYQGANSNATGTAAVGAKTVSSWLNENTLSYVKTFGEKHTINAVIGFTQQAYRAETVTAGSQGFSTEQLTYNDLGSGVVYTKPTSGSSEWALNSFLARVNYSLDDKYLFTVTARADGSSRFGANHRWGYFPSAAFAWNASKERFLNLPDVINNLKLRLSAGLTGNQEIGVYQSLSTLASSTYFFGGATVIGYAPNRIGNPDLGWESTAQYDAGIDIALANSRFTFTVDAYYKHTSDLLLDVPLPYTTGQSTSLQNYGKVSNKGLEFALNSQNTSGAFNWSSALTFSLNRNKVLSLGEGVESIISGVSIAQVGQPLGSFYGLKTNGIFQLSDDIANLPVYLTKNQPGDQRYVDKNGDNVITTSGDRFILGNAQPKFLGGLSNNLSYKNVDLNILFQGSYGNKIFNQNKQQLEILSGQQNASITALDRWTPENQGNVIPRAYEDPAAEASDRYVEDASYLRLKNLTIGYTFPLHLLSTTSNAKLRIYVAAQNLITWTNYTSYDPEVSKNGQSTLTQGIDYGVYPNAKLFTGGINLTL
ncbi:TonB-dependent receptor [Olivibacter ginsenosidimutans]|uniref:TonB-dependent receptor n=2 Tax=Olivibacter ginsenosidimutans TaxID=1176537 RepID=A0ABP9BUF9_9SPHI